MAEAPEQPGELNITLWQGQTWTTHLWWQAGTPPVEIDTAGYTALARVKTTPQDATPVLELSTANGRVVVGLLGTEAAGDRRNVTLSVSAADTAALPAGHYGWDLFLTAAGGVATPLVAGWFVVKDATSV